jgi:hypothetical protein
MSSHRHVIECRNLTERWFGFLITAQNCLMVAIKVMATRVMRDTRSELLVQVSIGQAGRIHSCKLASNDVFCVLRDNLRVGCWSWRRVGR